MVKTCRKERKKNHRCYKHIRVDGVGQLATFIVANDVSFRFLCAKHLIFLVRTVRRLSQYRNTHISQKFATLNH